MTPFFFILVIFTAIRSELEERREEKETVVPKESKYSAVQYVR